MSTPIETNTEELQEILNTVFNLPNAGGGGLPSAMSAMDAGTYTPDADVTANVRITHNLGMIPDFTFIFVPGEVSKDTYSGYVVWQIIIVQPYSSSSQKYSAYGYGQYYSSSSADKYGLSSNITGDILPSYLTEDTFTVIANSSYKLKSGVTYNWLACKFA